MVKIITVAGKEGSGKTSISINLALALRHLRKRVMLIDTNLSNPHTLLYFDANPHKTLKDFFSKNSKIEDLVYEHSSGLKIIFSSLKSETDLDFEKIPNIKKLIKESFSHFDYVILDSNGFGKESLFAVESSDELIFVTSPNVSSAFDVARWSQYLKTQQSKPHVKGLIVNMSTGKKYELTPKELSVFTDVPIFGMIPYDENVIAGGNTKKPAFIHYPKSKFSQCILKIATQISLR